MRLQGHEIFAKYSGFRRSPALLCSARLYELWLTLLVILNPVNPALNASSQHLIAILSFVLFLRVFSCHSSFDHESLTHSLPLLLCSSNHLTIVIRCLLTSISHVDFNYFHYSLLVLLSGFKRAFKRDTDYSNTSSQ